MFSKTRFSVILILLLLGCGEKPPESSVSGGIGGDDSISSANDSFQNYLSGIATENEMKFAFDQYDQLLKTFSERIRGAELGIYTSAELKQFIKKYFFKSHKLDDALWNELMFAKTVFLGGDENSLRSEEIYRLRSLLKSAKAVSLATLSWFPMTAITEKDEALFNSGISSIANFIRLSFFDQSRVYPINRIKRLIALVSEQSETSEATTFYQHMSLALASYEISFQPSNLNPTLGKSNIRELEELSKDVYRAFKSIHQIQKYKESLYSGRGLDEINIAMQSAIRILTRTLDRRYFYWYSKIQPNKEGKIDPKDIEYARKRAVISMSELSFWLTRVSVNGEFMGIPVSGLQAGLEPIFVNFLGKGIQRAINPAWIDGLRVQMSAWYKNQKALNLVFKIASTKDTFTQVRISKNDLLDALYSQEFKDTYSSEKMRSDIETLILMTQPLFGFEGQVVSFTDQGLDEGLTHYSASHLLFLRTVSQNVITGFTTSTEAKPNAISRDEFKQILKMIDAFGLSILILDPQGKNTDKKRFLESNLFLPSSVGDNTIDLQELTELLGLLMSGGTKGGKIQSDMMNACPEGLEIDHKKYGYPRVALGCFKEHFIPRMSEYFSNFPSLSRYLSQLNNKQLTDYFDSVATAANLYIVAEKDKRNVMSEDDVQGFVVLVQYIEMLYLKYDYDRSGTIDLDEAAIVFHQFKNELRILNQRLSKLDDNLLYPFFTFILAHGRIPSGTEVIKWKNLRTEDYRNKLVHADREKILTVFKAIADNARGP